MFGRIVVGQPNHPVYCTDCVYCLLSHLTVLFFLPFSILHPQGNCLHVLQRQLIQRARGADEEEIASVTLMVYKGRCMSRGIISQHDFIVCITESRLVCVVASSFRTNRHVPPGPRAPALTPSLVSLVGHIYSKSCFHVYFIIRACCHRREECF